MRKDFIIRRRYIIKKGLQFRYIGIVLGLVIITSLLIGYTVFITGWTLLGQKLAAVYPQARLIYVFKATNLALIRNIILISPLIFILALLSSHRIAGPVYRIEKSLDEIAKGNLSLDIKLRRGDELQDLAEIINTMREIFKKTVIISKDTTQTIQKDLDSIKAVMSSQPIDQERLEVILTTLQQKVKELGSFLDRWSIG